LEWKSWDARLRLGADPARAGRDIVILYIDQYSLDVFEKQGVSWPWPRQMYSAVVKYLAAGQARAVFFDMIFSEPSVYGVEDDADLARTMKESDRVFVPFTVSAAPAEDAAPDRLLARLALRGRAVPPAATRAVRSVSIPLDDILSSARGAGNVQFSPDGDSIYRRMRLVSSYKDMVLPSLPLALAEFAAGPQDLRKIPLDPSGQMIIRYHGGLGTYKNYSIAAIINSWAQIESGQKPQIPAAEFTGKVVFVAGSAPGLMDLRPSPLNPKSPGTEIHAAALDNLLRRDFIRFPASAVSFLLMLGFCIFTAVGVTHLKRFWTILVFFILSLALPAGAAVLGLASGYWLQFVAPIVGILLSFIGAAVINYQTEGRQRRFIKSAFRYYLSPAVIEQVLNDPSRLRLGGEKRDITSFFSDVAGFTSISEGLKPEELVNLLNAYLSEMTDIILDTGGTLDKYEGDAIIAFWNAPLDQPDHGLRACRAALRCQRRLAEMQPDLQKRFGRGLRVRIGLNSGPAVVGNMGSASRFDYTAMGDTINLASRLEGACKAYGLSVLIGEETYLLVKEAIACREVDTLRVVGKSRPVRVYEILGETGTRTPEQTAALDRYHRALTAYKIKEWAKAESLFEGLGGDPLARVY
ncbi:MAG: adenylate/guanylate cyclase domain-containing protein, partial [Candidatus Aminicenantes bacterium]|nr:adenylate/guanylate cyclase domain-containing protein [Candidatus Aminicenantes bacterium]